MVADSLSIAYFTVRKHRSNILSKLQLNSAAQLACAAVAMTDQSATSDSPKIFPRMPGAK
ncbi:LuxR C-terminal-related transcriptional regulator [Massilia sp. MB5]|uniref:LuxR C-terminal-related transcriptional regulator n=1 Tax=Massilia sp. MB5 TaxID=2919578 RepID=UPI0035A2A94B